MTGEGKALRATEYPNCARFQGSAAIFDACLFSYTALDDMMVSDVSPTKNRSPHLRWGADYFDRQ